MPRPRLAVPTYRRHPSGHAVITVYAPDGRRRDMLLGPHGSPESLAEYQRVLAELQAGPAVAAAGPAARDLTVNEVLVAFLDHARGYYRGPDGARPWGTRRSRWPSARSGGCTAIGRRPSSGRWPSRPSGRPWPTPG